jgi:hypothetical protein
VDRRTALLALGLLVLAPTVARADDGYVRDWLLLGPFPFAADEGRLAFDPLHGEGKPIPGEGRFAGGEPWRTCSAPQNVLDFLSPEARCAFFERGVVYAHLYVRAAAERKLTLAVGSDDGLAVWVNGTRVHFNDVYRGTTPDQDRIPVTLAAGWNRILFKVSQGVGGWGLCARFFDGGALASGLDIQAKNPDPAGAFAEPVGPLDLIAGGLRMDAGGLALHVLNVGGRGRVPSAFAEQASGGKAKDADLPELAPGEAAWVRVDVPLEPLLASPVVGDGAILPLAARGAVAPVISFVLAHVAPETTSAVSLPEADRAALLRAENALARMGKAAAIALAARLEDARGARLQVLARALARTCERNAHVAEVARQGALALVRHPAVLVRETLLVSGRTTPPALDEELLPELLGALAPASLPALAPLLETDEGRALGVRALAHAARARDEAALLLGKLLARTTDPRERWAIGRALSDLGGEAASQWLERALKNGPPGERRDRIADLEGTKDAALAPRALARALDDLSTEEKVRAFQAIAALAVPPPPKSKVRFVADPFAKRRSKDARDARALGREVALARLAPSLPLAVRREAARTLEALAAPEEMKDRQALAHALLEAFEREPALAVLVEEARALVELAPHEVLAAPFRGALVRVLGGLPEPALPALGLGDGALAPAPRPPLDAASRDRFVHALLSVLGEEEADLGPLVLAVEDPLLDPAARARAAALLARLGSAGKERLDALAQEEDEVVRACAKVARAGALARDQQDLYFEAGELARGRTPLERKAWVAILAYAGGPDAQGRVQGLARNDPSPLVRLEGTRALARVYLKPAAGILAQALFDASPSVRREAARALVHAGNPDVAGSICQAIARAQKLPDPDEAAEEERELRVALVAQGKDAVPSVANIAHNAGDVLERRIADAELGRIATDEAIAHLMIIVRDTRSEEDRDAAGWALEKATGRDLTDSMWEPVRAVAH